MIRRIDRWSYDPQSNELRDGGEVRHLEERAARALDLLLEREGGVVGREELIARVWGGRSVSPNSVPMAIGHLRKALGEIDGRSPIETIPKRGYRLVLRAEEQPVRASPSPNGVLLAAVLAVLLGAIAWSLLRPAPLSQIAVPPLVDATGDAAYAPLARASDALLVSEVVERGFEVTRAGGADDDTLRARLVMWDERPFLALESTREGRIEWSAMIDASHGRLPPALDRELDKWRAARAR